MNNEDLAAAGDIDPQDSGAAEAGQNEAGQEPSAPEDGIEDAVFEEIDDGMPEAEPSNNSALVLVNPDQPANNGGGEPRGMAVLRALLNEEADGDPRFSGGALVKTGGLPAAFIEEEPADGNPGTPLLAGAQHPRSRRWGDDPEEAENVTPRHDEASSAASPISPPNTDQPSSFFNSGDITEMITTTILAGVGLALISPAGIGMVAAVAGLVAFSLAISAKDALDNRAANKAEHERRQAEGNNATLEGMARQAMAEEDLAAAQQQNEAAAADDRTAFNPEDLNRASDQPPPEESAGWDRGGCAGQEIVDAEFYDVEPDAAPSPNAGAAAEGPRALPAPVLALAGPGGR